MIWNASIQITLLLLWTMIMIEKELHPRFMKLFNYDLWKSLKNEWTMVKEFSHIIMDSGCDKDNSHIACITRFWWAILFIMMINSSKFMICYVVLWFIISLKFNLAPRGPRLIAAHQDRSFYSWRSIFSFEQSNISFSPFHTLSCNLLENSTVHMTQLRMNLNQLGAQSNSLHIWNVWHR